MYRLQRRIVLLVTQVSLQRIRLNHLHVLQDQWSAVLLGVDAVVLLALSQSLVRDSQRLIADPLLSHHRGSGKVNLREVLVVDVVEGNQLWSSVVLVRWR